MAHRYLVETLDTGMFSGALSARKLEEHLNRKGREGWKLVRTIHETRKVLGLFSREAHFLVFERDGASASTRPPQG